MRRKRSTESKNTSARGGRKTSARKSSAALNGPKTTMRTWVAGVDGLSLGIAGAAIVVAGVLVAAYKPAPPVDVAAQTVATSLGAPKTPASVDGRRPAAAPSKSVDEASSASADTWPAPLTITGCLDRDGDSYRLTDAAGVAVPKSRSWKSGFLKKSASSVTLIDDGRRAHLQDHLGQRVSVTGTMVNREMQIGSIRLLSETCSEKTKI